MAADRSLLKCLTVLLGGLAVAAPLTAAPLRLNLDGTGTQDHARIVADDARPGLFVAVQAPSAADADREAPDRPLIAAAEVASFESSVDLDASVVAPAVQGEWLASIGAVADDSRAEDPTPAEGRRLVVFGPPALVADGPEPEQVEAVPAPNGRDAVPAGEPVAAAGGGLRSQRVAIEVVVVVLVFAVMLVVVVGRHRSRRSRRG